MIRATNLPWAAGLTAGGAALAAAVAAPLAWSVGGGVMRSVETAGPWEQAFWRALGGAVAVTIAIALTGPGRAAASLRAAGLAAAASAVLIGATFVVHVLAMNATAIANVLFLQTASPLLMPILAWIFLREAPHRATLLAAGLAAAGLAPIVLASAGGGRLAGDLLALASATCGAANVLVVRRARSANLVPVVAIAGLGAALVAATMGRPFAVSPGDAAALVALGVVQIGIGLSLFLFALRHLPAAPVALLTLLEPVVGPALAWAIVGEEPPRATILGGAIVLAAMLLSIRATARLAAPRTTP
ncbi:MAG: DMT family transporter [Alphaproteobacteria bacterium]